MPLAWKTAITSFNDDVPGIVYLSKTSTWKDHNTLFVPKGNNCIWEKKEVVKFVKEFYDNLKKAMPSLMSWRYYD